MALDTVLINRFSFSSLNAANAIGLLGMVNELVMLKKELRNHQSLENRVKVIEITQRISQKIDRAALEILSVSSEMDCEVERAEQIANYLKGKQDDAATKLTVGAIVVGASAAIATGILLGSDNDSKAPEIIGISAGITEATLGFLILKNNRKVEFLHPRNALKEIESGPEVSTIFPPSVWYYLKYENPDKPGTSLRQQLIDQWIGFGEVLKMKEKEREEVYALYLGKGGKYSADQLAKRANMYDQIEAYINLMKQDLMRLTTEIEKLNRE
jgi:hypothetical protein